jgi:anti-sigma-K factor RskA
MTDRTLSCDEADALAGAWGLDALDADEAAAVAEHLETCDRPHAELRALPGAGALLTAALDPIQPSPGLRDRVMRSIGERPAGAGVIELDARRERPAWLPRVVAGLAVAAAVVLAVWNIGLRGELENRDAQLQEVAAALSAGGPAYSMSGSVGGGVLVTGEDGPVLVADVEPPGDGLLYALWLIGPDGAPVAVGTFAPDADQTLTIVPLDRSLEGYATFAVTREAGPVDAPTSDPVLATSL